MSNINDELQLKLNEANDQKDAYLLPENIRKDITVFGITGTYDAGIQTADADALPEDIRKGKTAYVNNEKITGTLNVLDTSDATATNVDILAPKTAYVNGVKVTGSIECSYDTVGVNNINITALSKSLSYNLGVSEDGLYIADLRTLNSSTTLAIYKLIGTSVELVASTSSNIPGTTNPDIKFSPVIENGIYRLAISAGTYISVFDFNSKTNTLTYRTQARIDSYTSNSIYQLCYSNCNKNVFTVIHTNLNDWGYGPIATTIRLNEGSNGQYTYSTLWNQSVARWQAGHNCFWNIDDTAFCYNSTHESGNTAGYILVNSDYSAASKNSIAIKCCYIDVNKGHRIVDYNLQVYKGTAWSSIGNLPSTPSDPDFVVFNQANDLVFIGSSTSNLNNVYVYKVNWNSGNVQLLYTLPIPTDHMFFGSNNGSQVIGMMGFNKARTIVYNRKTTPNISIIGLSQDLKQVVIGGKTLTSLEGLSNPASASQVLTGKQFYDAGGLATGTMPNNGSLSYIPGDNSLTIPTGYTSGGTIQAVNIANLQEYSNCLEITEKILGGNSFPYTRLEYIETNNGPYINTEIALLNNNAWTIELNIQPTAVNYDYNGIWGIANGSTNYECWIGSNGYQYARYNNVKSGAISMSTTRAIYKYELKGTTVYIYKDNSQIAAISTTVSPVNSNLNLLRCSASNSKAKLYEAKLFISGSLVAHYIPVLDYNGLACLYDDVTGTLKYGTGGSFIAGPVKTGGV